MTNILITGGAGYIGSHMVLKLLEAGYHPVVVDDLSTGMESFMPPGVPLHRFSIGDADKLNQLLRATQFDIVMHFAAFIEVGESVKKPEKYYQNNFFNTLTLLHTMKQHGINHFIFSSTAAIFGEPHYTPADENHPKQPLNPYGASKLMCEQLLQDLDTAYGIKSVCLRYFNAAGADPAGRTGYRTANASHLIPIALQTALGQRPHMEVYGRDYPTLDGTCIRDYIHIMDLCDAHLLAMQHLLAGGSSRQYNLGNGQGYSVQQVIDTARQVTGQAIQVIDSARRPGDPAKLVADSRLIQQELGWKPRYPELATIIEHAWKWEKQCYRAGC